MFHYAAAGSNPITSFLPFIILIVVFYFFLIRPQQRKQKNRASMLRDIQQGSKIVTIGGLHGTVVELNDKTVVIQVNDATQMTFDRSAISHSTSSAGTTTA